MTDAKRATINKLAIQWNLGVVCGFAVAHTTDSMWALAVVVLLIVVTMKHMKVSIA